MKNKRREFIKLTGMAGLGIAGAGLVNSFAAGANHYNYTNTNNAVENTNINNTASIIGAYGAWAAGLTENKLPSLSYRRKEFTNREVWKKSAKERLKERLAIPAIGSLPKVTVKKQYTYDGLHIEELSWQLPYGPATDAILLKPENAKGKLPAILAFHDHGGNKYFGTRKITKTSDQQHLSIVEHQKEYYEGMALANEIAK